MTAVFDRDPLDGPNVGGSCAESAELVSDRGDGVGLPIGCDCALAGERVVCQPPRGWCCRQTERADVSMLARAYTKIASAKSSGAAVAFWMS